MREQAEWNAHAAFMNDLADEGFVVAGGPLRLGTPIVLRMNTRVTSDATPPTKDSTFRTAATQRTQGALDYEEAHNCRTDTP